MKSTAIVLTFLLASANGFAPPLATRAVGKTVAKPAVKKVPAAKASGTKVVAKAAAKPVAKKAAFSNPFAKKEAAPVAKKAAAKPAAKKVVAKSAAKVVAKKVVAKKEAAPVAKKAAFSNPFAKKEAAPVAKKVVAKAAAKKVVAKAAAKKVVAKAAPKRKVGAPKPAFKLPSLTGRTRAKPSINFQMPSTTRSKKLVDYVIDDGLTVIERKQRGDSTASFLTGSAKSRADKDLVRDDVVVGDEYYFSPFDTTLVAVVSLAIISVIVKAGSP